MAGSSRDECWVGQGRLPSTRWKRSLKNQTRALFAKRGPPAACGIQWSCAAKGKELWSLGRKCFPEMMSLFERLKKVIDTAEELTGPRRDL